MAGIFISYRRDDERHAAGRLADELAAVFGAQTLFRDIESIAPGQDFEDALNTALAGCAVMLVVIGRHWLDITDAQGRRRLTQPGDWVRTEVATALRRGIPVVPVLVDGAGLPPARQLPEDLRALAKRRAVELTDGRWRADIEALVQQLAALPGLQAPAGAGPRPGKAGAAAAAVHPARRHLATLGALAVLVAAAVVAWPGLQAWLRPAPAPQPAQPAAEPPRLWGGQLPATWQWQTSQGERLAVRLRQQGAQIEGEFLRGESPAGRFKGSFNGIRADVNIRLDRPGGEVYFHCPLLWMPAQGALAGPCAWPGSDSPIETWVHTPG